MLKIISLKIFPGFKETIRRQRNTNRYRNKNNNAEVSCSNHKFIERDVNFQMTFIDTDTIWQQEISCLNSDVFYLVAQLSYSINKRPSVI